MAYVIIGTCINDSACVEVCPVDCIHPRPDEPGYTSADMLWVDPEVCIDCNACAEACPIDAVMPAHKLPPELSRYEQINADFARESRS